MLIPCRTVKSNAQLITGKGIRLCVSTLIVSSKFSCGREFLGTGPVPARVTAVESGQGQALPLQLLQFC